MSGGKDGGGGEGEGGGGDGGGEGGGVGGGEDRGADRGAGASTKVPSKLGPQSSQSVPSSHVLPSAPACPSWQCPLLMSCAKSLLKDERHVFSQMAGGGEDGGLAGDGGDGGDGGSGDTTTL